MIGNFLYSDATHPHDVLVKLGIGSRGEPTGRVVVPEGIQVAMARSQYPVSESVMSAEGALSYGLFLAIRAKRSLIIGGDPTAWDPAWGQLLDSRRGHALAG